MTTRNPAIKSLRDVTEKDRIAVPGIKTSLGAIILQMAAAKEFGDKDYAKLDHLTVSMPYPDAVAAMLSGKSRDHCPRCLPPFSYMELDSPGIHKVFNSVELFGHVTTIMAFTTEQFRAANPKLTASFVAAMKEAIEFIAANKPEAARIYVRAARVKSPEAEILRIINDPDLRFTLVPEGHHDLRQFHAPRRSAQGEAGDLEGCVRERAARPSRQLAAMSRSDRGDPCHKRSCRPCSCAAARPRPSSFMPATCPQSRAEWDPIFLSVIGSPDPSMRQLNGMGGGVSSLSKVCVIGPPSRADADVDYTFAQVLIDSARVDYNGNCGNMSSAIGPFALDEGLVPRPQRRRGRRAHPQHQHQEDHRLALRHGRRRGRGRGRHGARRRSGDWRTYPA